MSKNEVTNYMTPEQEASLLRANWYNLRPKLGFANWAIFYILLGARELGKSYSVANYCVDQFINKEIPFVWIRLTERQSQKLLANKCAEMIDPDIQRKYNLNLTHRGKFVYDVKYKITYDKEGNEVKKKVSEKLIARVLNLSTFYTDKGAGFDKDFLKDITMRYNIVIDEFQREKNEKKTFDIAYALMNQLENILRSTKTRTKIFLMGNTLQEASDILCLFNFIPEKHGLYKLVKNKKMLVKYLKEYDNAKTDKERLLIDYKYQNYDFGKRAVIHFAPLSEQYKARRKNAVANMLMPKSSTLTNQLEIDKSMITKQRVSKPLTIIKFSKEQKDWFTVWDSNIILPYNGEKKNNVIAMRPYLDELYSLELVKVVIDLFDTRSYLFRHLITYKQFQNQLELLKPRKG